MKLTPGLLLSSRDYIRRRLEFRYFDVNTEINGKKPSSQIIPFLKYLKILDENHNISGINNSSSNEQILQHILLLFILKRDEDEDINYRWMTRAYMGIKFIRDRLDDNMNACLRQANLFNEDCKYMEGWWDIIYAYSRNKANESNQETGREGEKLSFSYEFKRVGIKPKKEYIFNTSAGYDLLSRSSHNSSEKLLIEVKSSHLPISKAEAFITKKEFKVARDHNNYKFHFWLLGQKKLAILDSELVIKEAPMNEESGVWDTFKISFKVYKDYFNTVAID